jgi:hypothetical protein
VSSEGRTSVLHSVSGSRSGNRLELAFEQTAASNTQDFAIETLGTQKVAHPPVCIGNGQPNATLPQVFVQFSEHSRAGEIHHRGSREIADHHPNALSAWDLKLEEDATPQVFGFEIEQRGFRTKNQHTSQSLVLGVTLNVR